MWVRSKKGGRYAYYFEPSKERGEVCERSGSLVSAVRAEAELEAVVFSMTLSREWLRGVARGAVRPKVARLSKAEVGELEARKRRVSLAYVEGGLDDGTYRSVMREIERELGAARTPVSLSAVRSAGERMWTSGSCGARRARSGVVSCRGCCSRGVAGREQGGEGWAWGGVGEAVG